MTGCQKDKAADNKTPAAAVPTDTTAAKPAMPPGHGAGAAAQAAGAVSGKVLETMNSGGYTYVKVAGAAGEVWAAGPETKVAVGDEVSFSGGAPMPNFHSDTLNRTFDVVYFVGAINTGGAAAAGAMPTGEGNPHGAAAAAAPVAVEAIEKAKGGQSVAEIYAAKDTLAGKQVVVRGKVVKFNGGIMGRNWIHLQDGTGAAGSNDLMVTSNEEVAVGDVVTATGIVAINKDFGAGYNYALIVEDAKFAK